MRCFSVKLLKFCVFLVFVFLISCDNPKNPIPYKYVDITLDLNKPEFIELKAIGNIVEITGGISGIIVYRSSTNEYKAYERTCTYDPECERIELNEFKDKMVHNCCGSEFSLTMDGIVYKGLAELPLINYKVIYYQNNNSLRILNQ